MQYSLLYDSFRYVFLFWLGDAVNTAQEEEDLANSSLWTLIIGQPQLHLHLHLQPNIATTKESKAYWT